MIFVYAADDHGKLRKFTLVERNSEREPYH